MAQVAARGARLRIRYRAVRGMAHRLLAGTHARCEAVIVQTDAIRASSHPLTIQKATLSPPVRSGRWHHAGAPFWIECA